MADRISPPLSFRVSCNPVIMMTIKVHLRRSETPSIHFNPARENFQSCNESNAANCHASTISQNTI
jgi:hypothetical protein